MARRIRKLAIGIIIVVVVAFIGIQFVPVDRSNPPVTMDIVTTAEVRDVLRRSCYDCHSNETVWPWYSYVAPVSWRVGQHVRLGRGHMNFSTWDRYNQRERAHLIEECYEEAVEGSMPLPSYLRAHRDARLSADDLDVLRRWAESAEASAATGSDD